MLLCSGVVAVVPNFPSVHWLLELFSHFQIQAVFVCAAALVVAAVMKSWRLCVMAVGILPLLAWNLFPSDSGRGADFSDESSGSVMVAFLNVYGSNRDFDAVCDWILSTDADVVGLGETRQVWFDEISERLGDKFPYRESEIREDSFGMMLLSKVPFRVIESAPESLKVPLIVADISLAEGDNIRVLVTHPLPPMSARAYEAQRRYFDEIDGHVGDDHAIVIGDLNSTPWAPAMKELMDSAGLVSSRAGRPFAVTWHPFLDFLSPLSGLPLDHVLHTRHFRAKSSLIGGDVGSDHRGVAATLRY